MRPVVLRDDEPPDDAVVVIRGGEMVSESVRRSAERNHQEFGFFGISVYLAEGVMVEVLCATVSRLTRYAKVRLSTAGRLLSRGFALLPTLERPHFDVMLPDLAGPTLSRLNECFDPPLPNPGRP